MTKHSPNRDAMELRQVQDRFMNLAQAYVQTARLKTAELEVPNNRPTNSSVVNAGIAAGTGLLALAAAIPAYRFVQSARKGYKDRVTSLSDVTRASQAWEVLQRNRDQDYLPLRARLETEPELLNELLEQKKREE